MIEQLSVIEKRELLEAAQNIARHNEYGDVKVLLTTAERIMSFAMQQEVKIQAVTLQNNTN